MFKCKQCGKIHRTVSLADLTEEEKKQLKVLAHRVWNLGYYGTLAKNNELWEVYQLLSRKQMIIKKLEEEEEEELDYEYYQQIDDEDVEAEEEE